MVTINKAYVGRAMTTLAGVGLLGLAALAPAGAQNRSMSNGSTRSNSDTRMMRSDYNMDDEDMAYPAPLAYPMASPDGLNMYHYRSYRANVLADGSVRDAEERHEMMMDRRLDRRSIKDDPMMADPMPLSYPMATPDGIDLYHFQTYRSNKLVAGSPTEAREEEMMKMDRQRRMETRITDDEDMAFPMPMGYPMAAPGSLDMYYFRTYRGDTLVPGSVVGARERREQKLDRQRRNEMKNSGQ